MEEPDRRIFGPPDDEPMLAWYNGAYSHAFVALHPFYTVEGLDPASCHYGTVVISRDQVPRGADVLQWAEAEAEAEQVGKELGTDAVDEAAKCFGQRVRWRTICNEAGFADHRDLDRALRTHIQGLRHDLCDPEAAERLVAYCRERNIFLPTEGTIQPVLEVSFVELFKRAGLSEFVIADEFGDDERLVGVGALAADGTQRSWQTSPVPRPKRLYAPDRSLLAWVHWDSFFTVIFGTSERLAGVGLGELFEGFWCSPETTVSWLFEPHIALTQ